MTEIELIEQAAVKVGMTSLLNHGAASCAPPLKSEREQRNDPQAAAAAEAGWP